MDLMDLVRPSASRIVIAILESERDAEPRQYGSIATTQHALERAIRRIAKAHAKCEVRRGQPQITDIDGDFRVESTVSNL